ncbi:MAG: DNA topoisomerase I [Halothiobacillaceae bacterium]|nr:MAG: DNA topoisomerase I [Halothiobacillaceae bacterium]
MSKHLVVVESPAKAKTIKKYLGKDFEVMASYGHVRDLVPKEGAVDTAHDFAMRYEVIDRNAKHVEAIRKALAKADDLYLAPDPDREGEAIAWHLAEIIRADPELASKPLHRVTFNEITPRAVQEAVASPRDIAMELVNAQQARRALDYLVGFNLSPLLWRKIQPGLSAGRVQSPALRLIVEREEEIEAFVAREYWTLEARLAHAGVAFGARLTQLNGAKVEQFSIVDERGAHAARERLIKAANGQLQVRTVERKQRKRYPAPPFTTSTLQQEAVRKLGFSASRAMRIAQQLYEGIALGEQGSVGLITYMRTDSVNLAEDALRDIRGLIAERFGADQMPDAPARYKTKAKNAQEAHEAIRPTSAFNSPERVKPFLSAEQFRLYEMIWKRTVACQMIHATLDTVSVDMTAGEAGVFRATGSTVRDPGFMRVYREDVDEPTGEDDERRLPPLEEGEIITLADIGADQHFTEPPPRYSEASLVKTLEEYGIGRPSTYASIISTLQDREYVVLDARRFKPTDVGRIVSRFLTDHFTQYVDLGFTAGLEDQLDAISRGEVDWIPVMHGFWDPFTERVRDVAENVSRQDVAQARELGLDPASGKPVSVRLGRFGPFAQIGTKEDEDKPRFASLRAGQSIATITLDEALALFTLPRALGELPGGEAVQVSIGRFGPYVKYGSSYVSLAKTDDPYTVTLERAIELIEAKQLAEANRVIQTFASGIQVLNGRYGPYITDGEKNARIPKDKEPKALSELECIELLAKAKAAPPRKGAAAKTKAGAGKTKAEPKAKVAAKPKAAAKTKAAAEGGEAKPATKPRARKPKATEGEAPAAKPARRKKAES